MTRGDRFWSGLTDACMGAWAYLTIFEWFGWRFYGRHFWLMTKDIANRDPGQLRWFLGMPSFGLAFWLWSDSIAYASPGFKYIAPLISENTLGFVFFLHGLGTEWRVYSLKRGMLWSSMFGALGMLLYTGYPIFVWFDLQRITGQGICMAWWGVVATFVTARIGRGEDRSGS